MDTTTINSVNTDKVSVIEKMNSMGHEQVLFCQDEETGLKAIIAIHNTVLGPALGGTRMWNYATEEEALIDVLRLSKGMTYKASISGLNLGGGKAVIIGDSRKQKSEALFRRFGKFVNSLNGKYITAEDVGINPKDMSYVAMETNHVSGLPGKSGDPSPVTAYGVYMGMKASAKFQYGNDNLSGKKVVVQGVGHVGGYLVELLHKEGAKIFISDIHEDTLKQVAAKYNAEVVGVNDVYDLDMDIYAPCALGATVNDNTLNRLKCSIIAGAANNQLAEEKVHGERVKEMGIVYAPDYLINAGGLMNVYSEIHNISREQTMAMAEGIYQSTLDVLNKAAQENVPTYLASNRIAEERVSSIAKIKQYI
jgi:leucine dehydrogenase